jgi:carboxymethylenebutenolidase
MRSIKKILSCCSFFLLLNVVSQSAWATGIQSQIVSLPVPDGTVSAELYAAPGESRRPAVIILHGRQGLGPFLAYYQRYAAALANAGIDAYLLTYYGADEIQQANNPNAEQRHAFFASRVRSWSHLISAMTGDILAGDHASGQIGLLGFSQGGFLAAEVAGTDRRITALGVFYGGIPNAVRGDITHLPPLLELHGDADGTVPLAEGKGLVDLAKSLGQPAEMVVYPGAGHGFSGTDHADAKRRIIAFFRQHLQSMAD